MSQVNKAFAITAVRGAVFALIAASLAGCGMLSSVLPDDKIDYRSQARKTTPLEVPPDLTPLARDGRYTPQNGSISASELAGGAKPAAAAASGAPTVALSQAGDMRIERAGEQRWLVTSRSPEQVWPQVREFLLNSGLQLSKEDAAAGVMETEWNENRAKLPQDIIRESLGKVFESLYSTGERDKFRIRIERTASGGSEVYLSHRGLEEVYSGRDRDSGTIWTNRPTDHDLEAEMLSRMMLSMGGKAATTTADAGKAGTTPAAGGSASSRPTKARVISGEPSATMQLDDGLERAWRRVGLALDRSGFTVEERDRTLGSYAVRYVDPNEASKDGPNFLMRWFGAKDPAEKALGRYRIMVKADGANATRVNVLTPAGEPDNGANAQRIVTLLVEELKY